MEHDDDLDVSLWSLLRWFGYGVGGALVGGAVGLAIGLAVRHFAG